MIPTEFRQEWNLIQAEVYALAVSKGWHYPPREDGTLIALIHSELSEALEALRSPGILMDEKCTAYQVVEVELADAVIRIMDYAASREYDVAGALLAKHEYNRTRSQRHGGKQF